MEENGQIGLDIIDLDHIIGFSGRLPDNLHVHPDNLHIIYPLGFNVIIENITTGHQTILSKHTHNVTSIAIDRTGRFLATGQMNFMGFKAPIIVWDYVTRQPIMQKELHKVKIQALSFTLDGAFLISLGGFDCGAVVVWSLAKREALCGAPAQHSSAGITNCLAASQADRDMFITAGSNTICIWRMDVPSRKIRPTNVRLGGGLKREVICVEMADHRCSYPYLFCGTPTGDILCINMSTYQLQFLVPIKDKFSLGVTVMSIVAYHQDKFDFLIGTGDGLVGRYEMKLSIERQHHVKATLKSHTFVTPWKDTTLRLRSAVTSIAKRGIGHMFFVGTANCQIYKFSYAELSASLIKTCHSSPIIDIIFAFASSSLFVTCTFEEIRVWNATNGQELSRYTVKNLTCNAICITRDGSSLYSAWDDGKVRVIGFKKEKDGKVKLFEKFTMRDVHNRGVTAIDITSTANMVVTGGGEGQVRVWQIITEDVGTTKNRSYPELLANMKEHKATVTCIKMHPNNRVCASTSLDGSSIVWDLEKCVRRQIMLSSTLYKCMRFGPNCVHILTCGSDSKISYWDVQDGVCLRELNGSMKGGINSLDISSDGKYFVTGGEERLLKLWRYNDGDVTHVGVGHSVTITKVCICPNRKFIVSGGVDGAIHIWKFPDVPLTFETSY